MLNPFPDQEKMRIDLFAPRGWAALGVTAVFGLAACGGGDSGGSSNVTTTTADSAGIEVVSNAGEGWTDPDGWRLEPVLTVGEMEGEASFASIGSISIASDGTMYVLDIQEQIVLVFDADGNLLRKFGGQGGGPGEFTRATTVQAVGTDMVLVGEAFPPKLHLLDTEGELIESHTMEGPSDIAFFGDWKFTADGKARILVRMFDPQGEGGSPSFIATVSEAGEIADTIASWVRPWVPNQPLPMFQPSWVWALGPGESITASPGGPYEFHTYPVSGGAASAEGGVEPGRVVRLERPRVTVTEEMKEAAVESLRELAIAQGAPDNLIDEFLGQLEFEETLPSISSLWVSEPGGFTWVGIPSPDAESLNFSGGFTGGDLLAFDVFSPDGAFMGRVPAPESFRPMVVMDDIMYGAWTDDLDVPYVRSFQIVKGSEVLGLAR